MTVAAASGSVGDTIAPRTKAAPQGMPGTSACAVQATATIVASTSATVLSASQRRSARKSLPDTDRLRHQPTCAVGRTRISLSVMRRGRLTAKAMTSAMS